MMISLTELKTKWDKMDSTAENYLLVSGGHPLSVHVGYNVLCHRSFVVYNVEHLVKIPSSKSVAVTCTELDSGRFFLSFSLLDSRLEEVFTLLCWDLIDYSDSSENALAKLIERYGKWQKLLQQYGLQQLTSTAIKGLIGELIYLSGCVDLYGEDVAIFGWVGSYGSDQDFVFDDKWAEIKTTRISSDEITISSLQQLDRDGVGYLVVYYMDETSVEDTLAYTLKDLIESLEDKIHSETCRDRLWVSLALRGCVQSRMSEYSDPRFRVADCDIFRIQDKFPKLVKHNIPVGINSAKYTISLPSIEIYREKDNT